MAFSHRVLSPEEAGGIRGPFLNLWSIPDVSHPYDGFVLGIPLISQKVDLKLYVPLSICNRVADATTNYLMIMRSNSV